jgi:putative endonuclease
MGEIDRIMIEGDALVFVEVKTRRGEAYGRPSESVTAFKRRQIARSAAYFLSEEDEGERPCRFDVAEVTLHDGNPPVVRLLRGAFDADMDMD